MPSYSQSPAQDHIAVTKSDSTEYDPPLRALYVGSTGNVSITSPEDTTVTYVGVPAGVVLPVSCKKVNSTNTTASDFIGLY